MNRFGIVINNLHSSQLAYYAIRNVNAYLSKDYMTNFIFFVKDLILPCVEPECGIMRWEELWGYDGHVITTDVEGTRKALVTPGPKSINLYSFDLDWLRRPKELCKYEDMANIYQNPIVKVISRTEEQQKIIERVWNINVAGSCDDFNIEKMLSIIGDKDEKQS